MSEKCSNSQPTEVHEINPVEIFLILKKRFWQIMAIVAATVIITTIISFKIPPVYRSSFIISLPVVFDFQPDNLASGKAGNPIIPVLETEKIMEKQIISIKERNYAQISEDLGITIEEAKKIVSLNTQTEFNSEKNLLEITIDIKDNAIVEKMKNGILAYLNNNKHLLKRISHQENYILALKEQIQIKINDMNDFNDLLIKKIKDGTIKEIGFNPMIMQKELLDMKQDILILENMRHMLRGYEIIMEPSLHNKPVYPWKALNIFAAGIFSLVLASFLAFFMEWIEKNRGFFKKK